MPTDEPFAHLVPTHPASRPLAWLCRQDLSDTVPRRAVPPLAHREEEGVVIPVVCEDDRLRILETSYQPMPLQLDDVG